MPGLQRLCRYSSSWVTFAHQIQIFFYKTLISICSLHLKIQSALTKRKTASNNKNKFILFVRSANFLLEQYGFFLYKKYPKKWTVVEDLILLLSALVASLRTWFQKKCLFRFSLRCFDLSRSFGLQRWGICILDTGKTGI